MNIQKIFLTIGAAFGFTGVALGAFGAHALKSVLTPEMLGIFETAVRYQMYHAFALIASGAVYSFAHRRYAAYAGWSFMIGVILFSGSLYAMVVTGINILGAVTPFGGVALLAGWFFLFLSVVKIKKEN